MRAFSSVWKEVRVAEAPKEGVVRFARGYTLTQKMYLACNLRVICVNKVCKTGRPHPPNFIRLLLL